jgi:putative transcriptional regulator
MRRSVPSTSTSLAGSLLLAHPSLRDPNFRRSVILLSSHDDDGAMGVVINRPLGQKLGELGDIFATGPLATVPLFAGGPVQPKQVLLCGWQFTGLDNTFRLHFGLLPEQAEALQAEEGVQLRAFLGYSGWSGGQLENELRQDTWVVSAIPANFMTFTQDDSLWRGLLGGLNHQWKVLADEPEDPSLN